jgi:hypothetical protein
LHNKYKEKAIAGEKYFIFSAEVSSDETKAMR